MLNASARSHVKHTIVLTCPSIEASLCSIKIDQSNGYTSRLCIVPFEDAKGRGFSAVLVRTNVSQIVHIPSIAMCINEEGHACVYLWIVLDSKMRSLKSSNHAWRDSQQIKFLKEIALLYRIFCMSEKAPMAGHPAMELKQRGR